MTSVLFMRILVWYQISHKQPAEDSVEENKNPQEPLVSDTENQQGAAEAILTEGDNPGQEVNFLTSFFWW